MDTELQSFTDSLIGSDVTKRNYTAHVRLYLKFLRGRDPSIDLAKRFVERCKSKKLQNITVATYIAAVKAYLRFKDFSDDDLKTIKSPPVPVKLKQALLEDDWEKFLAVPDNLRDKAIAYILLYGRCRVGGLLNLRVEDFNKNKGTITVREKYGEKHIRKINPKTIKLLSEYIKEFKLKNDDFFANLSRRRVEQLVKEWAKEAGLSYWKDITPHALRRGMGRSFYYKTGKDIGKTRILLGHKSVAATIHYLGVSLEEVDEDYGDFYK